MEDRPLTACPECSGEIDLTFAVEGDIVTCSVCGMDCVVIGLDPPEVELIEPS